MTYSHVFYDTFKVEKCFCAMNVIPQPQKLNLPFHKEKSPRYFDLVCWHFSWKFKSFWNKFSKKKQTHCDNCSSLLKNWKVCQWSYPGFISKSANFCIDPWTWHGKLAISAPPSEYVHMTSNFCTFFSIVSFQFHTLQIQWVKVWTSIAMTL